MVKLLFFSYLFLRFLVVNDNPFTLLNQPKNAVDAVIGKPVALDSKDGKRCVYAYPFSKFGDYHILYVSDTARAFTYKPKSPSTMTLNDIPTNIKLTPADVQPENGQLLVSGDDKVLVEVKDGTVRKITYLK